MSAIDHVQIVRGAKTKEKYLPIGKYFSLVHAVNPHSNKSLLAPPSPRELEQLAQQSRTTPLQTLAIEPARVPVKSLRRRLSPHEIKVLVGRYNTGTSLRALSLEYGVSRSGLRHFLQGEGVTLREYGITPEGAENAVRLYESGLTIRQVAGRVGYSYGTIRTILHKRSVAMRASGKTMG